MPPRNDQQQAQHAGPSASADTGMQPDPSTAPAAADFPLLLLPHAVLAQHVWPLLSPWGRAQLRATCKELRQLSDGLLEGTMQFSVYHATAGASAAQQQQGGARQALEEWTAKCALLARCVCAQSLKLWLNAMPSPDQLQQLCTAAGGRITHLQVDLPRLTADFLRSTLEMVPSLCSALRTLHLSMSHDSRIQHSATPLPAALLGLPATLESLYLELKDGEAEQLWPALACYLAASTHLTRLHSLKVEFSDVGPQVDVSPLVPIASQLTHLHVEWNQCMHRGVAGLPQLLAACSTSLTSLALTLYAPAAPDHPSLAQVLAVAPNLQQLEVLQDGTLHFPPFQPPTAADVHALRTHPNLRRLVVHSRELCEQLAAAALPPGSLQHLGIELRDCTLSTPELLLQLLSIGALSAGSRLVNQVHAGLPQISLDPTQLDADLLSRLAQALRESGLGLGQPVSRQSAGGQLPDVALSTVPGVVEVIVYEPLIQPSDQQAAAALLSSLSVWHLNLTLNHLFGTFRKEAEAVQAGSSGALWLLPSLACVSTLSIMYDHCRNVLPRFAAALSSALSHGYLPQLWCIVFWCTYVEENLVGLAQLLKACCVRPGLQLIPSHSLNVSHVDRLRAALGSVPAAPSVKQCKSMTGSTGAAGSQVQQSGATLDDEGRRLLLQHLLC